MTKLTCIVGLIPLMLFAGPLWTGLAITLMGGLALGTLVTLGLIPVLYELLFGGRVAHWLNALLASSGYTQQRPDAARERESRRAN